MTHIEYNKKLKKSKDEKLFVSDYVKNCGFKCCICGEEVSPAIVKFFDDDITVLKCYKCQSVI